MNYFRT